MAEAEREIHPSPADLDRFLLGDMSPRQAAPVLAHLFHGCDECRTRMEPLASAMFGIGAPAPEPALESGAEYDFPLFKAFATARRYAAARAEEKTGDRQPAMAPVLKEAPILEISSKVRAERDLGLCQRLIESCRALRHSDPETLVMTATLAVALAERLDPSFLGAAALADLQACALAELGNARRIADDLAGAESDLSHAAARAAQGTGDPLLLARLMDLTASLYTDQRRFDEARQLLDAVYSIYEREGDRHSAGRALISKAYSANYAFDVEEAVPLFIKGLALIDPARDPKLAMITIHNLIWSLVECGQAARASQLFEHSRPLVSSYVERLDAVKAIWLEGRIAAGLGDDERAEQRFREARESFEAVKMPYDVALVSLDMAALWLRAGRTSEIMDLIDGTITIFRSRGIRREAIGMLLVVREAFQKRQMTEALLRTAAAELLRLEDSPARRGRVSS
jgi:tetratricopeptide (TPR) repeat protein